MMNFDEYVVETKSHSLSGVILISDNMILLVRPKKFRRRMRKWSIPKGHIEAKLGKIKSALKELEEESTIKLNKAHLKMGGKTILDYFKAGVAKKLICYIVNVERENLRNRRGSVTLINNMILGNFLRGEIVEAGFFSKEDAEKIIERHQIELLKYLE